ncbi:MAG: UDP-N-acetylglucosamine--N-acetylmuramyl-(pentapeptide) pyrophosphoryl-undecaprenol N-acetylglucosamine transferase, partial [Gammaproteobacteria bacterium]
GGFVSGPGGIAAWLCRVPLVIHEQNAVAGLTNRVIRHIATRVLAGYPQTFNTAAAVVTGNPVRASIAEIPPPASRQHDPGVLRVLVLGGSRGAHRLNEVVPEALGLLPDPRVIRVWHQTGASDLESARNVYRVHQIEAQVSTFIDDMTAAYQWADIVVCRAGAITVAEIAASGVASIFVPFPYAVDDHQAANAAYLADRGAAVILREHDLTAARLQQLLAELAANRPRLLQMACRARECAFPNATHDVAIRCLELIS